MKTLIPLLALLATITTNAATYYVAHNKGDDGNPGTVLLPLRTVQAAVNAATSPGDTVIVRGGWYDEDVVTAASGSSGSPITFQTTENAQVRSFRILDDQYIVIDGFWITGAQNAALQGHVRIENDSHYCSIINCTIGPGVFAISDEFNFDPGGNTITSTEVDFVAAGFKDGGSVFLGGSGLEDYWFANHDTAHTISTVSSNTLTLSTSLLSETNSSAWSPVYAGQNSAGMEGIIWVLGGGYGATGTLVADNVFTNLFGPTMTLNGSNHVILRNEFTKMNSYYGIRPNGYNHIIASNYWHNSTNIIYYTPEEIGAIPHPPGPSWYDYQVGFIHATGEGQDFVFERNWIEGIDQQLGQINETSYSTNFLWRSNVVVGVASQLSGGRNALEFQRNTFYRVGYDYPIAAALAIGGNAPGTPATNQNVTSNLFLDIGSHGNLNLEGAYSSVNQDSATLDYNLISTFATIGYTNATAFAESNGINGGLPRLVNAHLPRGADGIPWTNDDGLRPLPSSELVTNEWGALGAPVIGSGEPTAHFFASWFTDGFGWRDETDENYDLAWTNTAPFLRGGKIRPWETPEEIGESGDTVAFNAQYSMTSDSDYTTNNITGYLWNFGDGTTLSTLGGQATNTYAYAGEYTVWLRVTNNLGNTATTFRKYKVDGTAYSPTTHFVRKTGDDGTGDGSEGNPWLTIQHALNNAAAGDTIDVGAGTFAERLDTVTPGYPGHYVTIDGAGTDQTIIEQYEIKHPYQKIQDLTIKGNGVPSWYVELERGDYLSGAGAHYAWLTNVVIDGELQQFVDLVFSQGPSTKPFGDDAASNVIIEDSTLQNGVANTFVAFYGENNTVRNCTLRNGAEVDFFYLFGQNHLVYGNVVTNAYNTNTVSNHPDLFQIFTDNGFGSKGHKAYNNRFVDLPNSQPTQFSNAGESGQAPLDPEHIGDVTFHNNVYANFGVGASCTIRDVKYFNNVFYKCNFLNEGAVMSFGSRDYAKAEHTSGNIVNGYRYEVTGTTGQVTYDGTPYDIGDFFDGTATTTYSTSGDATATWTPITYGHGATVVANVFLDCGGTTLNISGYWGINNDITNCWADFNWVSKELLGVPYSAVRESSTFVEVNDGTHEAFRWWEANGINGGDPGFWDEAAYDFTLRPNSGLINAGYPAVGIREDARGYARPNGNGYDIGPYEGANLQAAADEGGGEEPGSLDPNPPVNLIIVDRPG